MKSYSKALCGRLLLRCAVAILLILLLVRFGGTLLSILLPFVCALLLAHLVNPFIKLLQKRFGGTRRIWSVVTTAVIVLFIAAVILFAVYCIYDQLRELFLDWPEYLSRFLNSLRLAFDGLSARLGIQIAADTGLEAGIRWLVDKLTVWITEWQPPVLESAGNILIVTGNVLLTVVVFILSSFYMMGDYPRIRYFLSNLLPEGICSALTKLKSAAKTAIGGYFKAQFILSGSVAVICFIVLFFLKQPFALLISIIIGVVDFIPIFGSGTVLVPWAIVLVFSGAYSDAFALLILTAALFLLRKLAEPRVLGDQTGLSPLLSLICIYIGMRLGGVLGMILAPVVCMMLIELYKLNMFEGTRSDCRAFSRYISQILNRNNV